MLEPEERGRYLWRTDCVRAQLIASSEKAIQVLGWKPKYNDLNTIVASAWAWHKSHPHGFEEG